MRKSELENFRVILEDRRRQILKNISDSNQEIVELRDNGAVDELDVASINIDSNLGQSISEKQKRELAEIDIAIRKIDDGNYGICEMCEENIAIARLKAKPHAKFCITCKELSEKNSYV